MSVKMKTGDVITPKPFGLAVRAVLCDPSGRCLLLRRSAANKHYAGCWEWPGGKVDPGEEFSAALHRELAEETGLSVTLTGVAGAVSCEMDAIHVVILCMEAEVTGGVLRISKEHDATEWVPLSAFSNWQLSDQIRPFMLDYAARRCSRQHLSA